MATLTLNQFQKKVQAFAKRSPDAVAEALTAGAEVVRGEAQVAHFGGSTSAGGGFYGEQLRNRSGTLRKSITSRVKSGANPSAKVGTNVVYAAVHEFGHRRIPQRPYLRPALEEKREEILDLMLRKLMEAYRRGV